MSEELAAFLRARLDEEAEVARAAAAKRGGGKWTAVLGDDGLTSVCGEGDGRSVPAILDPDDHETSVHIARHDPARVLREVGAKRALLAEHQPQDGDCTVCALSEDFDDDADGNREWFRRAKPWPCPSVRLLATEHADHPDYKETWRP
ncbi:hypothetical protein GCM10011583_18140 [Streptomyces camponoticapitis]|uniref:Uncharacterized protein n=1 Tax=Streptomyces camponoticapitis TaxID=1616125 RepID=A0ABQ2E2J3_9ACTN|nr:DUF6221 family protein [Streptomyces camponoticapitis]GGJ86916.1 hypothetical protein GCM10011583_18140 [Streptomyces camponoticapitis]